MALETAQRQAQRYNGHYLDEAGRVRDNLQFSYRNGNSTLLDYLSSPARLSRHPPEQPQRQRTGLARHPPTQLRHRDGHHPMKARMNTRATTESLLLLSLIALPLTACKSTASTAAEATQPANAGIETTDRPRRSRAPTTSKSLHASPPIPRTSSASFRR